MPQTEAARINFWRMVWDYDITTIVMLNEDNEGSGHRHADIRRYCPSLLKEWETFGPVQVLKVCLFFFFF